MARRGLVPGVPDLPHRARESRASAREKKERAVAGARRPTARPARALCWLGAGWRAGRVMGRV